MAASVLGEHELRPQIPDQGEDVARSTGRILQRIQPALPAHGICEQSAGYPDHQHHYRSAHRRLRIYHQFLGYRRPTQRPIVGPVPVLGATLTMRRAAVLARRIEPLSFLIMIRTSGFRLPFALLLFSFCASAQWDDGLLKPYVIDHRGATTSPADVSFLHDTPAGKDGFRS